jgi:hypothetical protein
VSQNVSAQKWTQGGASKNNTLFEGVKLVYLSYLFVNSTSQITPSTYSLAIYTLPHCLATIAMAPAIEANRSVIVPPSQQ